MKTALRVAAVVVLALLTALIAYEAYALWRAHQRTPQVLAGAAKGELSLEEVGPRRVAMLVKEEAYRRFYMHRTGHWLGMDVHDVGDYKIGNEWRVFEPGMALTIEPGTVAGLGILVEPLGTGATTTTIRGRQPSQPTTDGDTQGRGTR